MKWISFSESKPIEGTKVIVFILPVKQIETAIYYGDKWGTVFPVKDNYVVSHWMPLPVEP